MLLNTLLNLRQSPWLTDPEKLSHLALQHTHIG